MGDAHAVEPDTVCSRIERWLTWYVERSDEAEFLVVAVPDGWYVQWLLEDDGSLHAEASSLIWQKPEGTAATDLWLSRPQHEALLDAGFTPPDDQLPNYWKLWPSDWIADEVAAEAAWVLEHVFDQGPACELEVTAAIDVPR
jgi:hypothetical protein